MLEQGGGSWKVGARGGLCKANGDTWYLTPSAPRSCSGAGAERAAPSLTHMCSTPWEAGGNLVSEWPQPDRHHTWCLRLHMGILVNPCTLAGWHSHPHRVHVLPTHADMSMQT